MIRPAGRAVSPQRKKAHKSQLLPLLLLLWFQQMKASAPRKQKTNKHDVDYVLTPKKEGPDKTQSLTT